MYRTKQDVDKHVRNIFNRIKNEKERNLRGYSIAKLYSIVNDPETAKRYLAMFLSVREKDAPAHKLMAQIHEKSGLLENAIQSYKKSLELDESQKDIVLKICEIYCHLPVDPERARYWADRAEKLFSRNDVVFKLRECIVSGDGEQNNRDLEDLIAAELAHRPKDANLRIKLLKLYLDTERSKAAYDHAIEVENQHPFSNDVNWYYCFTDVLETYAEDLGTEYSTELFLHMLHAYDRQVYLTLEEHNRSTKNVKRSGRAASLLDSAAALHSFDQLLFKACKHVENEGSWDAIINHYKGQLYFYMGNFLLKRAQKDQGNLKEASRMSAGLFLIAYSFKPIDRHVSWCCRASEIKRKELELLHNHACFRLSQSGHMVRGMCKEDCSKWLPKIRLQVFTVQCRDKIYQRVLSSNHDSSTHGSANSHFMTAPIFLEFSAEFPDLKSLQEYDKVVNVLYPESLHHHVWLALQYYSLKQKVQPDYGFQVFGSLQYDTNNLLTATAESLSLLDVEAFLYTTVRTTALALEESHSMNYGSYDSPSFQPVMISSALCTDAQSRWWLTAYQLFKNVAIDNLGELRRVLQHGIEVIRALGNHGLDVCLIVHLAETFADRAAEMKLQTESEMWQVLEKRAAHYWKAAIPMLEKLANNQTLRVPKDRLFDSHSPDPSMKDIKKWIEEGRFYLACQAMNINKHEEAIEAFDSLKSPYASYYQAVIFKKLAEEECNQPREQITSEMRSKHIILLTRARDALYATLDRLHGDRKHPLNQVLSDEIEDVETKLARIDPDMSQRHDFDALSDECLSTQDSDEGNNSPESPHHHFPSRHTFRKSYGFSHTRNLLMNSTPHVHQPPFPSSGKDSGELPTSRHRDEHIRPSPERLDAQMRSLTFSHDAVIKTIMDQNKALIDSHHSIVQALQQNKKAVDEVKSQLEELQKQIGKCSISQRRLRRRVKMPSSQSQENSTEVEAKGDDHDDVPNEDYYDGYYYDEGDDYGHDDAGEEQNNAYPDFHLNSAYKYCDRSVQNEYPYGNITGLQGTSTVTYAPPSGSRNVNHPSAYPAAYYQQTQQQMACPVNSSTPVQSRTTHPQALGPGYFGPSGPISASLHFSEGQKLPQFNFGTGVPPPGAPFPSGMYVDKQSVFSRLEQPVPPTPVQNYSQQQQQYSGYAPVTPNDASVDQRQPAVTTAVSGGTLSSPTSTLAGTTAAINPVSVYTVPSTPAHAFQILMPTTHSSPVVQSSVKDGTSTAAPLTVSPIPNLSTTESSAKEISHSVNKSTCAENDSYKEDEYAGPDFKPVIPLPDEVEVKTGEEEEKVLFQERAKLFRFAEKEWKERGIGYVKILWHEKMEYVRILMRRDQILKICANHYIQPDMTLTAVKNSETAWIWAAQDFADEEVRAEQFCIRFKTADIAKAFKREFENAKSLLANVKKSPPLPVPVAETSSSSSMTKADEGFGDKFKPKSGSWNCPECMINNDSQKINCAACETPKPGSADQKKQVGNSDFKFPNAQLNSGLLPLPDSAPKTGLISQAKLTASVNDSSNKSGEKSSSLQTGFFKFPTESKESKLPTTIVFGQPSSSQTSAVASSQSTFVFGNKNVSSLPKQAGFVFGASSLEKDKEETSTDVGPASSLLSAMANKHSEGVAASSPDANSSIVNYGGFTFSGWPTIKQPNETSPKPVVAKIKEKSPKINDKATDANNKPNPFSGFSFGSSKLDSSQSSETSPSKPVFFNLPKDTLSFSDLASTSSNKDLKPDPGAPGFSGAGETVFKSSRSDSTSSNQVDDYESSAEFKPIIALPEIVDTKTGEEEELKLFGERAKLFRLDGSTNEWKERGLGEIKLLQHKTTNRCRVLMRREQVLKICANHYITGYMELKPKVTSKNTWIWSANDFSEGELRPEILAVKFKTPEIAEAFRKTFEKCVEDTKNSDNVNGEPVSVEENRSRECPACHASIRDSSQCPSCTAVKDMVPLSELFKPKPGNWTCVTCLVQNAAEKDACVACETPNPGAKVGTNSVDKTMPLSEMFKPKPGTWTCATCYIQNIAENNACIACVTPKPGTKVETNSVDKTVPLSDLFKPKPGSWACATCLVQNIADNNACVACETPKPGACAESSTSSAAKPLSELFKPKPGSWTCATCLVQNIAENNACIACETPKPGACAESSTSTAAKPQFTFWNNQTNPAATAFKFSLPASSDSPTKFVFGSPAATIATDARSLNSSSSAASILAIDDVKSTTDEIVTSASESVEATNNNSCSSVSVTEFRFGSPQKFEFSFSGIRAKSPSKAPKSPHSLDNSKEQSLVDEDSINESENEIAFQPVIPLPEKIEVKTGEEDEDVLYCHRAKLFRWVDSEWKERGIGDIKILRHRGKGKIRLLMRRDQVLKICLNHCLTSEMKFLPKDEKSWVWATKDFAENEAREERFAIRFKNQEIAKQFMEGVNNAKDVLRGAATEESDGKTDDESVVSVSNNSAAFSTPTSSVSSKSYASPTQFSFKLDNASASTPSTPFSFGNKFGTSATPAAKTSLFGAISPVRPLTQPAWKNSSGDKYEEELNVVFEKKPPQEKIEKACSLSLPPSFYLYEDAPECPGCRGCSNENQVAAASSVEIVYEEKATPEQTAKALALQLPPNFFLYEKKAPCPGCRGCRDNIPAVGEKCVETEVEPVVVVVEPAKPSDDTETKVKGPDVVRFGTAAPALDFASLAQETSPSTAFKTSTQAFTFSGTGTKVFGGSGGDAQGSDEVVEGPEIHFEPVVPLPQLIEVKTGEEDETKLYGQRAKLYRYDDAKKEWKERGVGEMKLLKHKTTGRIRVLLRREQVYKIACNHSLTPDMHLAPLPTSDSAWIWSAMDFAEETMTMEKFAVKFKTPQLAEEFKKAFENCQSSLNQQASGSEPAATMSPQRIQSVREVQNVVRKENDVAKRVAVAPDSSEHSKTISHDSSEDDDDDDDDDDDEESVMFEKRVTLATTDLGTDYQGVGVGNLRVLYDDDVYGARIQVVADDGRLTANHLIAMQTDLRIQDKYCFWTALDFSQGTRPVHRHFRASFSSTAAAIEFEAIFKEGKDYAKQSEILEQPYVSSAEGYSDNGTATGGNSSHLNQSASSSSQQLLEENKNQIKACSPELAAALKEFISGQH